jgi:hypothetical protein
VEGKSREVKLIGRTEDNEVVFSDSGVARKLMPDKVEYAFFQFELDRYELYAQTRAKNWAGAVNIILNAIKPALSYLDLPNNNAAKLALDAGNYMMKAADEKARTAQTDEDRTLAEERYKAAYSLLKYAATASWFAGGQIADLKRIQCLVALKKPKTARQTFEQTDVPLVGDAAYGLYWLVKAQLDLQKPDYPAAMQAAIKSLCFENKDVNTFPDALLVSARCYEELQNWHRARDIYYEVARVFPGTDWSTAAQQRLKYIMDNKLTAEKEQNLIENVFFGLNEDVNKLVADYLASPNKVVDLDKEADAAESQDIVVKDKTEALDKEQENLEEEGAVPPSPPAEKPTGGIAPTTIGPKPVGAGVRK